MELEGETINKEKKNNLIWCSTVNGESCSKVFLVHSTYD